MSRKVDKHLKITYPPGCKELNEELSNDELVKRLKMLTRAFQDMAQDENDYKELAIYLASEFFLDHSNKDVKLLVACCIADIFRVFVPDAPYTEPEQLKEIFLFLIEQLKGLKDPESPSFKRYFYLLENLAWVKSFNISLELPDSSEILFRLFKTTFELINEKHSNKVSIFILDILCPMVSEADSISQDVLDIFLSCIIEPFKSQNRPAYEMARDLIKRTSSVLEPYIELFLSDCLIQNHKSEKTLLSGRVYDLIQELNLIAPSLLQPILPQLEFKLKSSEDPERMASTKMLAKMFSAPNSDLALQHKQLWNSFLSRFNDIDLNIRRLTTQSCQDIIIHHPELITDEATGRGIAESLKHRQHDSDENVRMDVVKAIVGAAKTELKNVPDDLLECVKERTLDKKFKVRREALVGLGQIYRKCYENDGDVSRVGWIRNKILHAYYQNTVDDKILVERILNTSLVPYSFDPPARMKQLYRLYSNLDEHAVRALQEIFKTQFGLRNVIKNVLDLLQKTDSGDVGQTVNTKILNLSRHLPEPEKAVQQLQKFFKLIQETKIRISLQNIVSPQCTCKKAEEHVKEIIKKLGNATPQNLLYATVKQLLERVAPVMIDNLSILALTMHVDEVIQSRTAQDAKEGLNASSGLKLLLLLSNIYPGSFQMLEVYTCLLRFIKCDDDLVVDMTMQILKNIGSAIELTFPEVHGSLLPVLQKMIKIGTMKQAKHAIRCIDALCKDKEQIFAQLFEQLEKSMNFDSSNFLTSVVAIGHLAQSCPNQFAVPTGNVISKFIFQELLMQDRTIGKKTDEDWYPDHVVSEETQAKIQSLKMIVRWLLGVKNNNNNRVNPTLRLLYSMVLCEGDLMERSHINKPEMARLRLQAGCCMLKLAQEPVYAEAVKLEQFETMALLINDPCLEVRQQFVLKLHKGLMSLRLPIQYMGILCLGALDPIKERRALIKQMLAANINRRREYIRQNPSCATSCSVYSVLPDYVLPYAVHLLAHDPDFKAIDDVNALRSIRDCLLFLVDPLLFKNDTVSFSFYSKMIENIKNTTDVQNPDSEEANNKLYAICDLTMNLLLSKMSYFTIKNFPADPVLPSKLYRASQKPGGNMRIYISAEILNQINRGKKGMLNKLEQKCPSPNSETHQNKGKLQIDSSVSSSSPPSPVSSSKSSLLEPHGNNKLKSARGINKARGGSVFTDSADNANISSTRSKSSDFSHSSGSKRGSTNEKQVAKKEKYDFDVDETVVHGRGLRSKSRQGKSNGDESSKKKCTNRAADNESDANSIGMDEEDGEDECAVEEDDDDDDDDDVSEESSSHKAPVKKNQAKQSTAKTRNSKVQKLYDNEDEERNESNDNASDASVEVDNDDKVNNSDFKSRVSIRKRKFATQSRESEESGDDNDDDIENTEDSTKPSKMNSKQGKKVLQNKQNKKLKVNQPEAENEDDLKLNPGGRRSKRKADYSDDTSSKKCRTSFPNGSFDENISRAGKKVMPSQKTQAAAAATVKRKASMAKRREGAAARAAKKYQDFEVAVKGASKKK